MHLFACEHLARKQRSVEVCLQSCDEFSPHLVRFIDSTDHRSQTRGSSFLNTKTGFWKFWIEVILNSPSQRSCSPKSALKSTMSLCWSCLGRKEKSESTKRAMTAHTRAHAHAHAGRGASASYSRLGSGSPHPGVNPSDAESTHTHVTALTI